ncbi:hypothetical protein P3T17_000723 [Paraburkholderia sp. GAS82]
MIQITAVRALVTEIYADDQKRIPVEQAPAKPPPLPPPAPQKTPQPESETASTMPANLARNRLDRFRRRCERSTAIGFHPARIASGRVCNERIARDELNRVKRIRTLNGMTRMGVDTVIRKQVVIFEIG